MVTIGIAYLEKAGWGLYRQRGTVSMRTNPKEGPALEQAITGYNDSKWHHYGVSISSAAPEGEIGSLL